MISGEIPSLNNGVGEIALMLVSGAISSMIPGKKLRGPRDLPGEQGESPASPCLSALRLTRSRPAGLRCGEVGVSTVGGSLLRETRFFAWLGSV